MAKRLKKKRATPKEPGQTKPTLPPKSVETKKGHPSKFTPIAWKAWLQAAAIIAAGLFIYWPALNGDWLWDDDVLVSANTQLHSLRGLGQIWFSAPTTDYWPLTWTLLWMEWHLWGNATLGYHLCSLALHITSGLMIWRLFNRLGLRFGWLGGLLFVIHPLAVESVAWISEIKNTLSLPFFLLSCDAWLDAEEKNPSGYVRSVLYYFTAMLAKTSTVMLPAVLLLYCWWKRGHVTGREIKRIVPYLFIALVLGLITIYFQNHVSDNHPIELGGIATRLIGAGTALFFYLGKFIAPVDLLPIYPQWKLDPPTLLELLTIPALAALFLCVWTQPRSWGRHVLFGSGFFVLNLLPVLGLVNMEYLKNSWVADHLIYLPMIGLIGLVVAGLGRLGAGAQHVKFYAIGTASFVMACLIWESHRYAGVFNNQEALWNYALPHNPQSWAIHRNLGTALIQSGRAPDALEQYDEALKIEPTYAESHNYLGVALLQVGRVSEAILQFKQALEIDPSFADAHTNWGDALMQSGQNSEAIAQFEQVLKVSPEDSPAHLDLGKALMLSGQIPDAMTQFDLALKDDPDNADAYNNLGTALYQSGRLADAIDRYKQAIQFRPDFAEAHDNLANSLLQTAQTSEAIEQYEEALKIDPASFDAHYNLGVALLQTDRISEAANQFEFALKFKPDSAEARNNLGYALMQTGYLSEALEQFKQALKIKPDYTEARENLAKAQAVMQQRSNPK